MIVAVLVRLSLVLMATTAFPKIEVTTVALIGGAALTVGLAVFGLNALRTSRRTPTPIEEEPSLPRSPCAAAS